MSRKTAPLSAKLEDMQAQKAIQVFAHWRGMAKPVVIGTLFVATVRGK